MDRSERIKQVEDEVVKVVEAWPDWKKAIAYRYIYNLGIRVGDIDRLVRAGLREEEDRAKITTGVVI